MRRRLPLLAATLALAAALPAHADGAEWAGFPCEYELRQTLTGRDGTVRYTADLSLGPWYAADLLADDVSGPGHVNDPVRIVMHCVVQSDPTARLPGRIGHHGIASTHATGIAYLDNETTLTYWARAGAPVYLCTYVEMSHGGGTEMYVFDEDDNAGNGWQCGLADND